MNRRFGQALIHREVARRERPEEWGHPGGPMKCSCAAPRCSSWALTLTIFRPEPHRCLFYRLAACIHHPPSRHHPSVYRLKSMLSQIGNSDSCVFGTMLLNPEQGGCLGPIYRTCHAYGVQAFEICQRKLLHVDSVVPLGFFHDSHAAA